MTKRLPPHLKKKPGPKPGSKRVLAAPVAVAQQVATAVPASRDVLQAGRNINTMPEPELRVYARQVGVSQRDAERLTVERLRANIALTIQSFIEQF